MPTATHLSDSIQFVLGVGVEKGLSYYSLKITLAGR